VTLDACTQHEHATVVVDGRFVLILYIVCIPVDHKLFNAACPARPSILTSTA
jgi:hypothetical protein